MLDYLPTLRTPHAALLLPLAALAVWWSARPRRQPAALFSNLDLFRSLPVTSAQRLRRLLPLVRFAGLSLLIFAACRPQRGISETSVRTEGIAIEAALDISGSMEALDFQLDGQPVSRLRAVRHVFAEFVAGGKTSGLPGRPNDQIGMIAFGGYADSRCPLTLDHGALLEVVKSLETPKPVLDRQGRILNAELLREEQSTAIGDALATSLERLKDVPAKSKVVILLSDGGQNAGLADPMEVARLAKPLGIRIHTIGIGHTGLAPMPVTDPFGRQMLQQVRVELDEKLLTQLAEATGGRYFQASDTDALRKVYAELDQLERSATEQLVYTEYRELYAGPLALGLALLLLEGVAAATRFRSLP